MTWNDAWETLNADGTLVERPGQKLLSEWVFYVTQAGGTLLAEAPVGVGKSFAYSIPLIWRVREKERCVISTETTALQDQLVDKDLPRLHDLFGPFKYRSLKGRNWYLCLNRAPRDHGVVLRLGNKRLGDGERRDVERVLGYRVDDDDWEVLSGDADWCAQNKCKPGRCYSSRARQLALDSDIVVTNHALLRTHADMYESNGTTDGILGDFQHLVIDEAHTLEHVLVDGWGEELSPYHLWKSMESVWDAASRAQNVSVNAGKLQEAERLMKEGIKSITTFFMALKAQSISLPAGMKLAEEDWKRETSLVSQKFLSGNVEQKLITAMEEYELLGPGRFKTAADEFKEFAKLMKQELGLLERGTRKIRKGMTAANRLARVMEMVSRALETRDGVVDWYGTPYAVLADGWKAWKGEYDVRLRCVPLDVSKKAAELIWKPVKSVTLVSGTLRDETDGTFRYVRQSLGLADDSHEIRVGSAFDYEQNQLVYVTPATDDVVDITGARYSMDELVRVLQATKGRALVLFTALKELEYAADELRYLQAEGRFEHRIFVQEKGVQKRDLVEGFVNEVNSVLLASKSFFVGVDFPGETCSAVVLAKFPLPQYNALCRAQIAHWRGRGFPKWYEREALQVFKQANGRLIRNETDRGVIAILDQRAANPRENVHRLVGVEVSATGSRVTNDIGEVTTWLGT